MWRGCGREEGGARVTLAGTRPDLSPPSHSGLALATTFPPLPPSSANPDLWTPGLAVLESSVRAKLKYAQGCPEDTRQLCSTLYNPMDSSPSGSSVLGDSSDKNTRGVAKPSSRESPQLRDKIQVSHIAGGSFTI